MAPLPSIHPEVRAQAGVTLVELMVAASVLGLALTATVSMLRTGMDMEYRQNLERQAYNLAYAALENPAYTYPANYEAMANSSTAGFLNTEERPVNVTVNVQVHAEEREQTWVAHNTTYWRRVDATVQWNVDGTARSITATKIIAQIQ